MREACRHIRAYQLASVQQPNPTYWTYRRPTAPCQYQRTPKAGGTFARHCRVSHAMCGSRSEQPLKDQIDIRGDIFSLGVLLIEMLTGRTPLQGDSRLLLSAGPQEWLGAIGWTGVPEDLILLLCRALAKDPADRFQTMGEFAEAIAPWAKSGLNGLVTCLSRMVHKGVKRTEEMTVPPPADVFPLNYSPAVSDSHTARSASLDTMTTLSQKLRSPMDLGREWPLTALINLHAMDGGRSQLPFDLALRQCFWAAGPSVSRMPLLRDEPLILGRDPGVQLVLEGDFISRRQLAFFGMDNAIEVEDLSSANGTLLNGGPIRRATLTDQDVIQAGGCEIRIHVRLAIGQS